MKTIEIRIYYEDTDFSGVVYHASYLRFLERGRTEYLRALGYNQSTLFEEKQAFMVRKLEIEFLKPAKIDDMISVETSIQETRGATLTMRQTIKKGDDTLITALCLIAHVKNGKPMRLPQDLTAKD